MVIMSLEVMLGAVKPSEAVAKGLPPMRSVHRYTVMLPLKVLLAPLLMSESGYQNSP